MGVTALGRVKKKGKLWTFRFARLVNFDFWSSGFRPKRAKIWRGTVARGQAGVRVDIKIIKLLIFVTKYNYLVLSTLTSFVINLDFCIYAWTASTHCKI